MPGERLHPQPVEDALLTEEQITELRTKHGRIAHVVGEDDEWEVVIKAPTRDQYFALKAALQDDAQKPKAQEQLFRMILVHPPIAEVDALLQNFPAIPDACSDDILKLLGAKAKKRQK